MRKFFAALLIFLMASGAAATTIESETLLMDLEESHAQATIEVTDLTSSDFTYITATQISNVEAEIDGETVECSVETLSIGSEVQCDTDKTQNFTVEIDYDFRGLVSNDASYRTFRYSHPIYRPTENFRLKVTMPPGAGLLEGEESSFEPGSGRIGSDGRRIFVEWERSPQIGDTLSFEINYRDYNEGNGIGYLEIIAIIAATIIISAIGFTWWRRRNTEKLDTVYGELSEDQKQVLELLKQNDGEMLQKDVVAETDYSKAKISGVVSELVDREIVEKEKEGRSNKLKISKGYSY